jgi:apolipoprotein D and lipocalin family protein
VENFQADRYLGKWYEIARLDHSFERGLTNVSAIYTRKPNGDIHVLNRGYIPADAIWKEIEGRARFLKDESTGSLKVSFFGPFYGGYHIIELDRDAYSYAVVTGPTRSYLWILSRSRDMNETLYERLVAMAAEWGFDTSDLVKVKHDLSG